jgi:hypothetical protein
MAATMPAERKNLSHLFMQGIIAFFEDASIRQSGEQGAVMRKIA